MVKRAYSGATGIDKGLQVRCYHVEGIRESLHHAAVLGALFDGILIEGGEHCRWSGTSRQRTHISGAVTKVKNMGYLLHSIDFLLQLLCQVISRSL